MLHNFVGLSPLILSSLSLLAISATAQSRVPVTPSATQVQEGVVSLTDSRIEYFSQGQGEPIVLLPFGGLTVGYMSDLAQDLANAGYRVVRMNFRGSGK